METTTSSIIIQRPVEEVFAFVTDARNNPLWQSGRGLKETRQVPDGPVGVGTRITETWSFMGRTSEATSEVTSYEPNRRYTRSTIGNGGPIKRGDYTFAPVGEGTRWTAVAYIEAGGPFAIAEPLLASTLKKGFDESMAEAKSLLERQIVEHAR